MREVKIDGEHPHSYLVCQIAPRRIGRYQVRGRAKLAARPLEASVRVMTGPAGHPVDVFDPETLRRWAADLLVIADELAGLQQCPPIRTGMFQ